MTSHLKPTLLLIEDDPDQVFLYMSKFELEGFAVLSAQDGSAGLRLAREHKPDLILLDLILVGENGMAVLGALKKDPLTKSIPVVILTNLVQDDGKVKAEELGAADFLVKTDAMPSAVVKRIKEIIKK